MQNYTITITYLCQQTITVDGENKLDAHQKCLDIIKNQDSIIFTNDDVTIQEIELEGEDENIHVFDKNGELDYQFIHNENGER